MKFQKREPKEKWSAQKVYHRRALVKRDVANFNREMLAIDGQIRALIERKSVIRRRISHKWTYLRQLEVQLKEALCDIQESKQENSTPVTPALESSQLELK